MEFNTVQKLMDEAYEIWQNELRDSASQTTLFKTLEERGMSNHVKAVMLGNLNYQVENGGFQQWVDNGYASEALPGLLDFLKELGTENANKVWVMLTKLGKYTSVGVMNQGFGATYWEDEGEFLCEECRGMGGDDEQVDCDYCYGSGDDEDGDPCSACDGVGYTWEWVECEECYGSGYSDQRSFGRDLAANFDDEYYKINQNLLQEVEDFFNGNPPPKAGTFDVNPQPQENGIRYPDIRVKLVGEDGNAFNIMGIVSRALRRHKVSKEEIDQYIAESTSGDYDNLLRTATQWVNVA